MGIAVPESGDRIEKSLGLLIKSQFTENDFFSVVGNTEIPTKAMHPMVILMTAQRIMGILSTSNPENTEWGDTEEAAAAYESEMDRYKLRLLIENDAKAMQEAVMYGWNYYYCLLMRSKDRKGRGEGLKMGTGASGAQQEAENVGLTPKMLHALGLGRLTKYNKVYTERE